MVQTRNVGLVTNSPTAKYLIAWQVLGSLEIVEVLRDYVASNPQREQIYLILSSWLGISNSALTKPEAMNHNEQARNNYPDSESFKEH